MTRLAPQARVWMRFAQRLRASVRGCAPMISPVASCPPGSAGCRPLMIMFSPRNWPVGRAAITRSLRWACSRAGCSNRWPHWLSVLVRRALVWSWGPVPPVLTVRKRRIAIWMTKANCRGNSCKKMYSTPTHRVCLLLNCWGWMALT